MVLFSDISERDDQVGDAEPYTFQGIPVVQLAEPGKTAGQEKRNPPPPRGNDIRLGLQVARGIEVQLVGKFRMAGAAEIFIVA